jgi:hypothetical protein
LTTSFQQAFGAYRELLKTGSIHSSAEGDRFMLNLKANVAGDILVVIFPKKKITTTDEDLIECIRHDSKLEQNQKAAFESLRLKFRGITLLPASLVGLINICISSYYIYVKYDSIRASFEGKVNLTEIWGLLPLIFLVVITSFYGKAIGFRLLKPLIFIIMRVIKLIRLIRNQKVKDLKE